MALVACDIAETVFGLMALLNLSKTLLLRMLATDNEKVEGNNVKCEKINNSMVKLKYKICCYWMTKQLQAKVKIPISVCLQFAVVFDDRFAD
jgi:hypothetical protein